MKQQSLPRLMSMKQLNTTDIGRGSKESDSWITEDEVESYSEKDKKLTAYHEAGHAIVSRYLESQEPCKGNFYYSKRNGRWLYDV
ncbi:MAG: hypothetical protein ACLTXR_03635 [Clostridia bacterium]